jgi:hypothetical protein
MPVQYFGQDLFCNVFSRKAKYQADIEQEVERYHVQPLDVFVVVKPFSHSSKQQKKGPTNGIRCQFAGLDMQGSTENRLVGTDHDANRTCGNCRLGIVSGGCWG